MYSLAITQGLRPTAAGTEFASMKYVRRRPWRTSSILQGYFLELDCRGGYMLGCLVSAFLRNVEYSDVASCPLASMSTSQDCTYIATCLRSYDTYLAFHEDPSLNLITRRWVSEVNFYVLSTLLLVSYHDNAEII